MVTEPGSAEYGSRPPGRGVLAGVWSSAKGLAGKAALSAARLAVQRGRQLLAEGEPGEALSTLQSTIQVLDQFVPQGERDTTRLKAWAASLLGEAAAATGDQERAREAFGSAVAGFAQLPELTGEERTAYAVALAGTGRVGEAIEQQRRAIDEGDESVQAVLRLTKWLRDEDRLADAERELLRLSPRFPADPDVALALAEVLAALESPHAGEALADAGMKLFGANRPTEALAAVDRACAQHPDSAEIAQARATVLLVLGENDQALEEFGRAIRLGGDEIEPRYGRALAFARAGRREEALAEIDRIGEDIPPGELFVLRGYVYYYLGDYQAAAEDLSHAFSADPTQGEVATLLGDALFNSGRLPEARQVLDRAVEIAPEEFLAHARRGQVLLAEKDLDHAIAELRRAAELDPGQAWLHVVLGEALRQDGQLPAALESLDRSLQIEPDSARAIGTRGQVLAMLGRLPEAADELRRAVAMDQSLTWASADLGRVLDGIGQHDEALRVLDKALANQRRAERAGSAAGSDGWRTAELLKAKAHVLKRQGDHAGAVKALRAAVRLARGDPAVHAELAYSFQMLGDYKQALVSANRAIKLDDTLVLAWATKGAALAQSPDRHDEAVKALEQAMTLPQDDAGVKVWTMVLLAEVYREDGNLDQAERWFREAIKAQHDSMPAHRGLGDTLRLQGRYDEAYSSLELAVALAPGDVAARRMLGYALLGAGRLEDALNTFQGALEISHGDPDVTADIVTVLTRLDNYEEALTRARAAAREHPGNLAARLALGSVLCDVGEFEEAASFLRPAAEDAPGNASVSYWLGWTLDNLGQEKHLEEARTALERAVAIDDVPAYRIELANILRALGDPAASGMYAEVIAALDPDSTDPEELAFIGWCHYGQNDFDEAVRLYRLSLRLASKGVEVQFDLALARLCQGQGRAELAADEYQYGLDQLQRRSRLRRRGLLQVALVDLQQARRLLKLDRRAKACEQVLRAAVRSLDGAQAEPATRRRKAL